MRSRGFQSCFLALALGIGLPAAGQTSAPAADQDRGFTEIESFQGAINSSDKLLKLDSTLGYDFNKHFGVFLGTPLYLTNASNSSTSSTTATSGSTTTTGIGNVYLGLALRAPHPAWNFGSTITAEAPTGSTRKGYSTGRVRVDWSNHLDGTFSKVTPFIDAGLANGVPSTPLVARPFTSLGIVGHLDEGVSYQFNDHVSVGASAYQIFPSGDQKVFSQVIERGHNGAGTNGNAGQGNSGNGQGNSGNAGRGQSANAGRGNRNRPFETASVVTGTGLTRENGFDAWVGFEPNQFWEIQAGFSRSTTFDLNSFTFNISFNIGKLIRSRRH